MINTDEMTVIVYVPEKEIMNIKKGQTAYVVSNNIENKKFPGWVKRVSQAMDPQSGTFKVTVGVNNKENKLRPGMFVNVHIVTAPHDDAVLIPETAIVYENAAIENDCVLFLVSNPVQQFRQCGAFAIHQNANAEYFSGEPEQQNDRRD